MISETPQPFYSTIEYITVSAVTSLEGGSQKYTACVKKDHEWSIFCTIYVFLFGYGTLYQLAQIFFSDPYYGVMKGFLCTINVLDNSLLDTEDPISCLIKLFRVLFKGSVLRIIFLISHPKYVTGSR